MTHVRFVDYARRDPSVWAGPFAVRRRLRFSGLPAGAPATMLVDGLRCPYGTPPELAAALARAMRERLYVHLSYGDPQTGEDRFDQTPRGFGYVARSAPPLCLPLRRPTFSGAPAAFGDVLAATQIVRVRAAASPAALAGAITLYAHPRYHHAPCVLHVAVDFVCVWAGGEVRARLATIDRALAWSARYGWAVSPAMPAASAPR